jgi:hypothetical protein
MNFDSLEVVTALAGAVQKQHQRPACVFGLVVVGG